MTIQHSDLTDPELHEPKGTSTATAGQVYTADGLGSGAWADPGAFGDTLLSNSSPDILELDAGDTLKVADGKLMLGSTNVTATAAELNDIHLTLDIADGSLDANYYIVMPVAGVISSIRTVIDDVVSTANITVTASIGGVAVTNGQITIATAGSAAGDVDSCSPSALNTVAIGDAVKFAVAGGGAGGAPRIHLVLTVTR